MTGAPCACSLASCPAVLFFDPSPCRKSAVSRGRQYGNSGRRSAGKHPKSGGRRARAWSRFPYAQQPSLRVPIPADGLAEASPSRPR